MSESAYAVTEEETQRLAKGFLAEHPSLEARWGHHFGDRKWPVYTSPEQLSDGAQWCVTFTDPTGKGFLIDHQVVLDGLRLCLYEESSIEANIISGWVTLKTAQERAENPLPSWGASRICQLGLFSGRTQKFPYGGHSIGDSREKRRELLNEFVKPDDSPSED